MHSEGATSEDARGPRFDPVADRPLVTDRPLALKVLVVELRADTA